MRDAIEIRAKDRRAVEAAHRFVPTARGIHGGKYSYEKVVYTRSGDKVAIMCPEHGEFLQTPNKHLLGAGCPECGKARVVEASKARAHTKETLIAAFQKVHGDRYDYSRVDPTREKVEIICKKHGSFLQGKRGHQQGKGCPKCKSDLASSRLTLPFEAFISEARSLHGSTFSYDESTYVNRSTKLRITCPEHGDFMQTPNSHLRGSGCPECKPKKISEANRRALSDFIRRANEVHESRYDYSKVVYTQCKEPVEIACAEHGTFWQTPDSHVSGRGCPTCGIATAADTSVEKAAERFEDSAKGVHKDRYDYKKVVYVRARNKVELVCHEHGSFFITPNNHLNGRGCPKCFSHRSKQEQQVVDFISSLRVRVETNVKIQGNYEVDLLLPDFNVAIEYNGLWWHCSKHNTDKHINDKRMMCKERGIRLITIFSDEWVNNRAVVEKTLKHLLGRGERLAARKTTAEEIPPDEAKTFLANNHLQGFPRAAIYLGLRHKGELVAVMSFSRSFSERGKKYPGRYELTRYASTHSVQGGASKLFKTFTDKFSPVEVVSYSDNRWFAGGVYHKLGFSKVSDVPPSYTYVTKHVERRMHKSLFRREFLPKRLEVFQPHMTERENCEANGLYQLFDCGKVKWLWTA